MLMSKPRVIKDFDKLDESIQEQIKLNYPYGFEKHLILFKNIEGKLTSALPFETDEKNYLIRMTKTEAQEIVEEDDDYNDLGILKKDIKDSYNDKYDGEDEVANSDDVDKIIQEREVLAEEDEDDF